MTQLGYYCYSPDWLYSIMRLKKTTLRILAPARFAKCCWFLKRFGTTTFESSKLSLRQKLKKFFLYYFSDKSFFVGDSSKSRRDWSCFESECENEIVRRGISSIWKKVKNPLPQEIVDIGLMYGLEMMWWSSMLVNVWGLKP